MTERKFPLGTMVMTTNFMHRSEEEHGTDGSAQRIAQVLRRHSSGDWGDLDAEDLATNDRALASGEDRIFSAYEKVFNFKVWVITEWDRSVTTILLPEDY